MQRLYAWILHLSTITSWVTAAILELPGIQMLPDGGYEAVGTSPLRCEVN